VRATGCELDVFEFGAEKFPEPHMAPEVERRHPSLDEGIDLETVLDFAGNTVFGPESAERWKEEA
jgi:hypothetical protein